MSDLKEAENIVHEFFIGGLNDNLQQPNLTKKDLMFTISSALKKARLEGLEEGAKIADNKFPKEIWNQAHSSCGDNIAIAIRVRIEELKK